MRYRPAAQGDFQEGLSVTVISIPVKKLVNKQRLKNQIAPDDPKAILKPSAAGVVDQRSAENGRAGEPDKIADLIHEVENLGENEVSAEIGTLTNQTDPASFRLGGMLSV